MKVGLIGSGFMGKAHAFGFATAERVFDLPVSFEMDILADATLDLAETRFIKKWHWPQSLRENTSIAKSHWHPWPAMHWKWRKLQRPQALKRKWGLIT